MRLHNAVIVSLTLGGQQQRSLALDQAVHMPQPVFDCEVLGVVIHW